MGPKKAKQSDWKKNGINPKDEVDRHLWIQSALSTKSSHSPKSKGSIPSGNIPSSSQAATKPIGSHTARPRYRWAPEEKLCQGLFEEGRCSNLKTCRFAHDRTLQTNVDYRKLKDLFPLPYKNPYLECEAGFSFSCLFGHNCVKRHMDDSSDKPCEKEEIFRDCQLQRMGLCPFKHQFEVRPF